MTKIKNFLKRILPENFILWSWHYPKAVLAAFCYGFPAKGLTVIGVAGTKGKTTTCHLIAQILETAGKKTAMVSTAALKIGSSEELNSIKMTTPSPFFLQRFTRRAVKAGCQYLVLETSSHALVQYRTFGIPFKAAVLTNLMPDHLEYHKTAKAYQASHQKMFSRHLRYLILNGDDPNSEEFLKIPFSGQKIIYGLNQSALSDISSPTELKTIVAERVSLAPTGSSFFVKTPAGSTEIHLSLLGKFNVYNALAALGLAFSQNISLETVKVALEKFRGAPGRMERIDAGQNFDVFVDYAHSPDSLINLFGVISSLKRGKVIVVFGACGERDASQRPRMGEILDENADYLIVTNDDPYGEDPEKIARDLVSGIKNKILGENLWKILDRKSAIEKAFSLAKDGDSVLILGKGAEQWQIFKDKKVPWDDRKMAEEILEKLSKS